jgi:hypothetical protein
MRASLGYVQRLSEENLHHLSSLYGAKSQQQNTLYKASGSHDCRQKAQTYGRSSVARQLLWFGVRVSMNMLQEFHCYRFIAPLQFYGYCLGYLGCRLLNWKINTDSGEPLGIQPWNIAASQWMRNVTWCIWKLESSHIPSHSVRVCFPTHLNVPETPCRPEP